MQLSIVTSLYNSAPHIQSFYHRISTAAKKITSNYEIIFVDDGSPDNSLELAKSLVQQDTKVCVVELSRNFGHHRALLTGLNVSKGEHVFLIDCDLEEEPELLTTFWCLLSDDDEYDVVYGVQKERKGGWFERYSGKYFYKLFNALSEVTIPENMVTARLMTRRYVSFLVAHRERTLMMAGLFMLTGFRQRPVTITKAHKGSTSYSFFKRLSQAVEGFTSFSAAPLHAIFWFGLCIAIGSMAYGLYLIFLYFIVGTKVQGWTSVMVSLWFFSGSVLFSIGLFGIYLSKIFLEVKKRPYSIIKKLWRQSEEVNNNNFN